MLHREGVLLVKFWLHLSRNAQKGRLKALEADPRQRWRVMKRDWGLFKRYDAHRSVSEHVLRRTGTAEAPWTIVEGTDRRYRHLTVAQVLLDALRGRLEQVRSVSPASEPRLVPLPPDSVNVISRLDMGLALDPGTYKKELLRAQGELGLLSRRLRKRERSLILVFEGPDAAGKGGAIRRLTAAMDARDYQVLSVAAPTDEERAHPYLWRFWRHLPPSRRVMIYDRSWYGRVLVERVEGFAQSRAVAAGLRGDQRIRGAVDRIRADRGEVLAGDHAGGATAPLRGPADDAVQAVQADGGGLAEPGPLVVLRGGGVRDDRADGDGVVAVDVGGGEQQGVGAGQGIEGGDAARGIGPQVV